MKALLAMPRRGYALLLVLLACALAAQQHRLFERAWFNLQSWYNAEQWRERSLWLEDYQVEVEAHPIGAVRDLSALTFDPQRRTLFSVTNKPAQLIELSLDGEVLRVIALQGFGDPEAIEYVDTDTYVIADEREQRLVKVRLGDATDVLRAKDFPQLALGIGHGNNKGFEGLAYDPAGNRLLVAKERDPVRIFEVLGFPVRASGQPMQLQINTDPTRDARLFVRDLSSLDFDRATGHLLALSDESKLVVELDRDGHPVSTLSLLAGRHGLSRSVRQPEGLATDEDGTLYLISEPNLFYRFRKVAD